MTNEENPAPKKCNNFVHPLLSFLHLLKSFRNNRLARTSSISCNQPDHLGWAPKLQGDYKTHVSADTGTGQQTREL